MNYLNDIPPSVISVSLSKITFLTREQKVGKKLLFDGVITIRK